MEERLFKGSTIDMHATVFSLRCLVTCPLLVRACRIAQRPEDHVAHKEACAERKREERQRLVDYCEWKKDCLKVSMIDLHATVVSPDACWSGAHCLFVHVGLLNDLKITRPTKKLMLKESEKSDKGE